MDPNQDRAVQAAFDGYISGADHAEVLAAAAAKGYKAGLHKAAEMAEEEARALYKQGEPEQAVTVALLAASIRALAEKE